MTIITRQHIPASWQRGITRAMTRGIKACRCAGGTYRVPSGRTSHAPYHITITLSGKVGECTCEAAGRYGAEYVCAHRGAVARAEMFFRSIAVAGVAA